jgi:hypothetical protein
MTPDQIRNRFRELEIEEQSAHRRLERAQEAPCAAERNLSRIDDELDALRDSLGEEDDE